MFEYLRFALILVEVLVIFNLLIIVHELGHFLAARWRGLVVDRFGIWFGKPIWKKKIGTVEYSLGCIPAGGFVSLPQLSPMESVEGKPLVEQEQLPPVAPVDKIIVAAAGPLASLALAFAFATVVWIVGQPVSESELTTTIGYVAPDSPAANAGLLPGDRILEVDGNIVTRFAGLGSITEGVMWNVANSSAPIIPIKIERAGKELTLEVSPETPDHPLGARRPLRQIGVAPRQTPMIASVISGSPAANAGLRPLDIVRQVDGEPLVWLSALAEKLDTHPAGDPVTLTVERGSETIEIVVTPQIPVGETKSRIGISWDPRGTTALAYPNPWEQISGSVKTIAATLAAVLSPKSDISAQHLSGPVGIMRIYYMLFDGPDGWRLALWFSVVLNVNLALLNLLPLPILDGGHITLAIIEKLRRRPLPQRQINIVQSAFAALIISFMIYVTFFDVQDLPWSSLASSSQPSPPLEMKFATPPPPAGPGS